MKKSIFVLTSYLICTLTLYAQYTTDWIRPADSYLKTGVMIVRDNQDNAIVTGFIQSQHVYTRKYNKSGTLQWENISSSDVASNYEKPIWINADVNDNILVTGYRYSVSSGREYPNAMIIVKYDPSGALLWKKTIPVSVLVGNSISPFNLRSEVDQKGNLYIGTVTANPSGFNLYKINAAGTILFLKSSSTNSPNGFNSMRLRGNKLLLTGRGGSTKVPVIAWDTAGVLLWTASYQGQGGIDIEADNAGNAYLLTSYANQAAANSGQDMIIYKLNNRGSQVWKKSFHFGGYEYPTRFTCVGDKISTIGYGNINSSYFDWITFQINTAGTMLWNNRYNRTFYNDEQPYFITAKPSGEVFVTGKGGPRPDANNLSSLRMITLKYDQTGATKWVDSVDIYGGWGLASALASDSSLYVVSSTNMTTYHFLDRAPAYCAITGQSISQEYISSVIIWAAAPRPGQAGILNNSFGNLSGYSDFTNAGFYAQFYGGDSVTINSGIGGPAPWELTEYYSIWIDYNKDKDFNDPGEQIANNIISNLGGVINIGFKVPFNAPVGTTRLRMTMSHDPITASCGTYPRGETEDYTVVISALPAAIVQPALTTIQKKQASIIAYPNPFADRIQLVFAQPEERSMISVYDVTGRLSRTQYASGQQVDLNLSDLEKGVYFLKVSNEQREYETIRILKQ